MNMVLGLDIWHKNYFTAPVEYAALSFLKNLTG